MKIGLETDPNLIRRLKSEKLDGLIVVHDVLDRQFYDYIAQVEHLLDLLQ